MKNAVKSPLSTTPSGPPPVSTVSPSVLAMSATRWHGSLGSEKNAVKNAEKSPLSTAPSLPGSPSVLAMSAGEQPVEV